MDIQIKKSATVKYLRLAVYPDGRVILTQPKGLAGLFAQRFLQQKQPWIQERLKYFQMQPVRVHPKNIYTKKHFEAHKDAALTLVKERLEYFNQVYGFSYNRVTVRNQKTRWGSCSKKGNLNFNYKILFLSPKEQDYIIVHELCHLAQFNHSPKFWSLVEKQIPEYKKIRSKLRKFNV